MKAPRRIADLDLPSLRREGGHYPSPSNWSDLTLYFLLIDRFSDGQEDGVADERGKPVAGETPLAKPEDRGNAVKDEENAAKWRAAGEGYVGGTLTGIQSKLGYLKRLGVNALWISPVLKQSPFRQDYHGYATQDFLQVEPRFGTAEDLRDLVSKAHSLDMRVILDVVINHAGNVFTYEEFGSWRPEGYPVKGWNDAQGQPTIPFEPADTERPESWPAEDCAVWPAELQNPEAFHRKGSIANWDNDPEFREGDFFDLKDFDHGHGGLEDYEPSPALRALTAAYKYWIGYADLDGFRIDTVKHMDPGAVRFFSSEVQEFAETLGKDDFFLVGEITGGRGFALDTLQKTGLDAALGISGEPQVLEEALKGGMSPEVYFDLFRKSEEVPRGSDAWFRSHLVTVVDDHDQVWKEERKARFAADPAAARITMAAFALNCLTLGIPCLYYGAEQGFDGHGEGMNSERYIREAMFGGEFGAFGSRCVHFFDENSPIYRNLAGMLAIRAQDLCLRRGRQFLREVSGDGEHFGFPQPIEGVLRSIVAWSRMAGDLETLVAINTDPDNEVGAWVTIDGLHNSPGERLRCVWSTDDERIGCALEIEERNGRAVHISLPPGGVGIYRKDGPSKG